MRDVTQPAKFTRPVPLEDEIQEGIFSRMRSWFSDVIGIDLGTKHTVIHVRGRGIVLREPTVVALKGTQVIAVGSDAQRMIGKCPPSIRCVRPLQDGVIADFDVAREMIRKFLGRVRSNSFGSPTVIVAVPAGVTEVEQRAVREAVMQAGISKIHLVQECLAAALGIQMDPGRAEGVFLVSIGSGTTQAVVMSLGEVVISKTSSMAGDAIDNAVVSYFQKKQNFTISARVAEEIKIRMAAALPLSEPVPDADVGGQMANGLPSSIRVSQEEIREAIEPTLSGIVATIREALESTPPDLASDLVSNGIVLVGGAALLRGLDQRIAQETGLPVRIAPDPTSVTALGAGKYVDVLERLTNPS